MKKLFYERKAEEFVYLSPLGPISIKGDTEHLFSVEFCKQKTGKQAKSPAIKRCVKELHEYFKGQRRQFSKELLSSLAISGTEFEMKVWRELLRIPYGSTFSYKQIAMAVGRHKAFRAVGNANHKNSFGIIIPCHRVITSQGGLGGYASGEIHKRRLLDLEATSRQ